MITFQGNLHATQLPIKISKSAKIGHVIQLIAVLIMAIIFLGKIHKMAGTAVLLASPILLFLLNRSANKPIKTKAYTPMKGILNERGISITLEASEFTLQWAYFNNITINENSIHLIKNQHETLVLSDDLFISQADYSKAVKLIKTKINPMSIQ